MTDQLTHIDESGRAKMVDVADLADSAHGKMVPVRGERQRASPADGVAARPRIPRVELGRIHARDEFAAPRVPDNDVTQLVRGREERAVR